MTGSEKILTPACGIIERLQVPRRSKRRRVRDNKTKKWAERSVWSMVCAIELGLIGTPAIASFPRKLATREKKVRSKKLGKTSAEPAAKSTALTVEESGWTENRGINSWRLHRKIDVQENQQNHLLLQEHQYSLPSAASPAVNFETTKAQNIHRNEETKFPENSRIYNPLKALKNFTENSNYLDIYELNRAIKNQTGPLSSPSSTEESSESDDQVSPNFPEKSTDTATWKDLFTGRRKKAKPPAGKKIPDERRCNVEQLRANKENRSDVHESTKDDRKVGKIVDKNEKPRKLPRRVGKIRSSASSPKNPETDKVSSLAIDSEGSEIDETLLVDPSTDLPGALLDSDDQAGKTIDLNPQFDLDFDMNFEAQSPATLEVSVNGDDDAADSETSKSEDEKSSHEEIETQKICVQKKSTNYWGNTKKTGKEISSFPEPKKKRRSADSMVTISSLENKENSATKNNNENYKTLDLCGGVGRITRGSARNCVEKVSNESTWPIGSLVWGSCMGWWPGLVVDAEDVGMPLTEGKSWIFWISEDRISHLRDKTQIQSFSSGLRSRMIETLRTKTAKDANYSACLATMKLLNDELLHLGPLTKPHHAWVEKNLATRDDLGQLSLHPYPPKIQKRVDELKAENSEATGRYLSELSESAEKSSAKNGSNAAQKAAAKPNAPIDPSHLPLASQKPGVITWAKLMGQIWWPAMIIDFRDCGMKEPNFGCQWILWYGDYTLSQVNHRFFLDFARGMTRMKEHAMSSKREVYRRGVVEAAKDYCSGFGYVTDEWSMPDVFDWFSKLDEDPESWTSNQNILPGIPGTGENSAKYPARILKGLRKHKGNCTIAAVREHNIKDSDALRSLALGKLEPRDLCLMCLISNSKGTKGWTDHPFFGGSLCPDCSEKYTPTIFAYGDDGKCFFCSVCAGSDTVVICDEPDCPRVYCTACLKYLIAPRAYDEIMLNDPFHCFLCVDSPDLLTGGLLKPRDDWKTRVAGLFRGKRDSVPSHVEFYYKEGKKNLRVLSLFDGISAGLVVLEKLGIHVEAYYASEINPDAEMVSSAHFGERIIRLGDVRGITEAKIRKIAPIHLLIGGSPCNDLSLVNPMRLGIHDPNGTGILVFEYRRVRNLVERANGDQHFFWLFENVASMPSKYRLEINRVLGREPELIDAANYSPQHRPRLYWSNFPVVSYPLSSQDLQDVLTKNCNRHALVKKIRTVTTRVNSLKQGKDSLKPILMNEENDTLWITELEEIFGFPRHYTDVKNLCATKRQKLIGKSWSIQTIAELMRPLCNFFQSRSQESL